MDLGSVPAPVMAVPVEVPVVRFGEGPRGRTARHGEEEAATEGAPAGSAPAEGSGPQRDPPPAGVATGASPAEDGNGRDRARQHGALKVVSNTIRHNQSIASRTI
ncbi:hypothetical protein JCM16408A_36830 [Methylobacterium phyllosphaerae]